MATRLNTKLRTELFHRAPASAIGSTLLLVVLFFIVPEWIEHPFAQLAGILVFISNVLRLWSIRSSDDQHQKLYHYFAVASGLGWGLLSTWVYLAFEFGTFKSQATMLIMSGIGASSLISLAASPITFQLYLFLSLMAPISTCLLLHPTKHELILFTLFSLYAGFLWAQSRSYYRGLVERFETAQHLEEEHNLLQTILDTVPGYLSYIDKDLRYVAMNANLRRRLNISESDYVGKKVGFLRDLHDSIAKEIVQFALSDQDSQLREVELRIDREYRWHLVCLRKSDDRQWIVCVSIDIHQEKTLRLETEAQKAKVQASAKMAALGEMSSGIAHEINNPLAVILGKAHRLERQIEKSHLTSDLQDSKKDLNSIQEMVGRIAKIIRGLQTFAREGEGDPCIETPLQSILDETLVLCQTRLKDHQIVLRLPDQVTSLIECRPTQLSQVFLNLLNNSFDAIKSLDQRWIEISVSELSDSIEIRITDSGAGIPQIVHERIFQPFFTTKDVGKGTGLGLSISSGIVRAHGGTLELDSQHPNTSFVIRLPRRQAMSA